MCSENSPAGATSVSTRWQSNPPNTADSVADSRAPGVRAAGGPRRHPRRATMLCILGISTPADFDSSFAPVEYTLSSLPPKLLMANKRPPPDAVIDGHAAEATLPDHFRQVKLSNISLVAYHSSELEQRWIDNVGAWQTEVCSHTSESDVVNWLGAVHHFWREPRRMMMTTSTADLPSELRATQLSAFTYKLTHKRGEKDEYVHVPIEPTASIARDPRKCWEPRSERYTQSKDHLLPVTHAAAFRSTAGSLATPGRLPDTKPPPPRAILFDAGATIPTSLSAGNGWTGTTWLYAWYKARGITFDKIHAWEPMSRQVNKSVLDPDFAAALNFYNRGCNGAEGHPDNPLTVIRQECRPEDLCIFKLDIDTPIHEMSINNALLRSPSLMALVDEYYFEHHVQNKVMAIHGGCGGTPTKKNDLASWYHMAIRARRSGMRMHFWP